MEVLACNARTWLETQGLPGVADGNPRFGQVGLQATSSGPNEDGPPILRTSVWVCVGVAQLYLHFAVRLHVRGMVRPSQHIA